MGIGERISPLLEFLSGTHCTQPTIPPSEFDLRLLLEMIEIHSYERTAQNPAIPRHICRDDTARYSITLLGRKAKSTHQRKSHEKINND